MSSRGSEKDVEWNVMKLGLISDIHGDLEALHTALDLLNGQGVTAILCLGDLVDKGSNGEGVVGLIRELDMACVRGNHDEDAYGNQYWMRNHADLTNPTVQERLLSTEAVGFLKNLPFALRFEWGNADTGLVRLLMVHGTPFNNSEYLLTTSRRSRYAEIAAAGAADVILFGHTHTAMSAFFDGVWFFNPGHVFHPPPSEGFEQRSTCATLTLPAMKFAVFDLGSGEQVEAVHIE